MKKLLLSLLLVTLLSQNSIAQNWTFYKDFPVNTVPRDIDTNNAGTLFMLTLDFKLFYKTVNGQWTSIPMIGAGFNPLCISVNKSSNLLLFGDGQSGLFFTSNFGATWGQIALTTDPNTGFSEGISTLSNMDNIKAYGGGFGVTDSNGNLGAFITKYTSTSSDVYVFDPSDIWGNSTPHGLIYTENQKLVIGTFNNGIWITQDNGATFQQTNFNQHQVNKFTEDATGRVYALGTNLSTNTDFLIYSDDYINWTPMLLPNNSEKYTTIYFDTVANNLWLGSQNGIYKILITPTSTTAWANANLNNGNQSIVEIIGTNNGEIYNFSTLNVAQKLNATGTIWNTINNGLEGNLTSVGFGSSNKLFGSYYFTNILSTANSSTAAWLNTDLSEYPIQRIFTKANGKIYIENGLNLKKSIDNGMTYTNVEPSDVTLTNTIFSSYVGETGDLFMVKHQEQDKLYWSQDEGVTWSFLHTFPSDFPFLPTTITQISQDSNGVIYVTTDSIDQSLGFFELYYSSDNGSTWNSKILSDSNASGFGALFSKNNKTFITIGTKTYKFDYSLPSNNFTLINRPPNFIAQNYSLGGLTVNNLGHYYVFGDNLYKSIDEGATWTNLGKPSNLTSNFVNGVFFDNNNQAYILAAQPLPQNQKGIYTVTETLGFENPIQEYVITLFPNPVQNILNIQTQEIIKEVSIYNLLGEKVIVNEISNHAIDVSNLAVGMYIIKVTGENDKTFSAKFIKR